MTPKPHLDPDHLAHLNRESSRAIRIVRPLFVLMMAAFMALVIMSTDFPGARELGQQMLTVLGLTVGGVVGLWLLAWILRMVAGVAGHIRALWATDAPARTQFSKGLVDEMPFVVRSPHDAPAPSAPATPSLEEPSAGVNEAVHRHMLKQARAEGERTARQSAEQALQQRLQEQFGVTTLNELAQVLTRAGDAIDRAESTHTRLAHVEAALVRTRARQAVRLPWRSSHAGASAGRLAQVRAATATEMRPQLEAEIQQRLSHQHQRALHELFGTHRLGEIATRLRTAEAQAATLPAMAARLATAHAQAATLPAIETQLSQAQGRVQELEQAEAERATLKADWLVVGTALTGIIAEVRRRVAASEPTGKNPLQKVFREQGFQIGRGEAYDLFAAFHDVLLAGVKATLPVDPGAFVDRVLPVDAPAALPSPTAPAPRDATASTPTAGVAGEQAAVNAPAIVNAAPVNGGTATVNGTGQRWHAPRPRRRLTSKLR